MTALLVLLVCATQVECGRDYYEILGVNRDASDKQISKAWRKLSIELHPDKHPEREAEYVEASSGLLRKLSQALTIAQHMQSYTTQTRGKSMINMVKKD